MTALELEVDLSTLVNAVLTGDSSQIIAAAREHLLHNEQPDVLIGRIGMIAAQGDPEGHTIITLTAAAMLCRLLHWIPAPLASNEVNKTLSLPLFVQALLAAVPAVQQGHDKQVEYPTPFYPSDLLDTNRTIGDVMGDAVRNNDPVLAERVLMGLYGTGADYRTLCVRTYDALATTFQNVGHPLIFAVRGFQLLDAVEWGILVPHITHWLTPHIPLRPASDEPEWVQEVRTYTGAPVHSVASIRTRLAAAKDESALPLRHLILSDADTTQVCQGVYDALMPGGASPRSIASVIALAAADAISSVDDGDRESFLRASHGLLFSAATHMVMRQCQEVEVLPLLFTSAAYINALQKQLSAQPPVQEKSAVAPSSTAGGGLIATAQLEALAAQIKAQDLHAAAATARRYLALGHDPHALFGTIGLAAGHIDIASDQGHSLQIVQAASDEFMAWPASLKHITIEPFLQAALRAAASGQRSSVVADL